MTIMMVISSPRELLFSAIYGIPHLKSTANLRAINHSPAYYPNPHTFDPRRFLGAPEYADAKPFPADKTSPSFGWGRRICPGEHLATNSVFITIAKICWAFAVRKYVDENGKVEMPDTYAYTDGGFNIRPLSFRKYHSLSVE